MKIINTKLLTKLQQFSNFLLLFIVILDPTNTIFGLKDIAFVFFMISNIQHIRFNHLFLPLIFLVVFFNSLSVGLITNKNIDIAAAISMLKSFLFLLYMFFVNSTHLNIFKYFYYISLFMAVIEICIYFLVLLFPILEVPIYTFMRGHGDTIMLNKARDFYGISLLCVFYKTSPILVITECFAMSNYLRTKDNKYLIHLVISVLGLLFSATRANMLSCILILFIVFIVYNFYIRKNVATTVLLFSIVSFSAIVVIFLLLTTSETSTDIKASHMESFFDLFKQAPFTYALLGSGPGTIMFTKGFNGYTTLTELTYLELIKSFGMIGTLIILAVIIFPIFKIYLNNNYDIVYKWSFVMGYFAYLFIAGTNPLLIGSTGFTVIMVVYYLSENNVLREMNVSIPNLRNKSNFWKKYVLKMRYL